MVIFVVTVLFMTKKNGKQSTQNPNVHPIPSEKSFNLSFLVATQREVSNEKTAPGWLVP